MTSQIGNLGINNTLSVRGKGRQFLLDFLLKNVSRKWCGPQGITKVKCWLSDDMSQGVYDWPEPTATGARLSMFGYESAL